MLCPSYGTFTRYCETIIHNNNNINTNGEVNIAASPTKLTTNKHRNYFFPCVCERERRESEREMGRDGEKRRMIGREKGAELDRQIDS